MDRFVWIDENLHHGEDLVIQQSNVRLYDGEERSQFDGGIAILTTHRLLWKDPKDQTCVIGISLSQVALVEEQPSGFAKSAKILLHLTAPSPNKPSGPTGSSRYNHVKLSFRSSGQAEFIRCLNETMKEKRWESKVPVLPSYTAKGRQIRAGIVGIERNIQLKNKATDQHIGLAFEDLSKLMDKAKEMVNLSKKIADTIKQKKGDITDDETVRFKSYLLSMGIPDPVTRETHGTGNKYYAELAKQLSSVLAKPIQDCGGMMTLTDAYCRVNRARGMELLSPEDLVNSCRLLEDLKLPVRLRVFDSGVMVLQLKSHSEKEVIEGTATVVEEEGSMTADELSKQIGLSVILAKERLLVTETAGRVCRDESVEGLRFYPNRFLTEA